MGKLNLPIAKLPADLKRKTLSMDEYLKFVNFNLRYTVGRKAARGLKKTFFVGVPFKIRGA